MPDLSESRKRIGPTTSSTSIKMNIKKKIIIKVFLYKPANLFNGIFDNMPAAFFSSDQPTSRN
jgi:hypothetical protein